MRSARDVISPEARFLLDGARGGTNRGSASRTREDSPNPSDWEALYELVARERAAAALHPVDAWLPADAPAVWKERFRRLGAISGFWQQQLMDTLDEVVGLLDRCSISVCLLKGAALARTFYGRPSQRPMGDLDLLVEEGRSVEAWEELRAAGWVWDNEQYPMPVYEPRPHLPPLEDPDRTGQVVELHDDLFVDGHPFELGAEDIRSSGDHVRVGGTRVLVPGPTQHLVYTCIHFAWAHTLSTGGWRTFRDVAVLSRSSGFDWRAFERMAREQRATAPCYWTLRLARGLGDVPIPEERIASLRPPSTPGLALGILERHFALALFSDEAGCPSVALERALWRAAMGRIGARHGDGEPWAHDQWFLDLDRRTSGEPEPGFGDALARHARNLSGWWSYARSVVGLS